MVWWIVGIIVALGVGGLVTAIVMGKINTRKQADILINVGASQAEDKDRDKILERAKEQIEKNKEVIKKSKEAIKDAKEVMVSSSS